jgi:hypothetical protein
MQKSWRLPVLAAALNLSLGLGVAAGQTVMVRNAPPGSTVEVALNADTAATGTADATGNVTLPLDMAAKGIPTEMDANVFVDVCEKSRKVHVVDHARRPQPPAVGCDRREIPGLFWVRPINTLVVDVGSINPTLLLVKGSYTPPAPIVLNEAGEAPGRVWRQAPTGLALFGGGALVTYRDARGNACGNVVPCSGKDSRPSYTAGGVYWIKKFLAAEGSYVRPGHVTASGGDSFTFNYLLKTDIVTVAGLVAAPIGPVRLYAKGGVDYQQATSTTTETIAGATQTFELKTKGFGAVWGGGGEAWITKKVAVYGEVEFVQLKGAAQNGGAGKTADRVSAFIIGGRIKIGR